ncbi:MAG: hypothetical protein Q8P52_02490 [bacterium]|nr:hypothetical protein [bacterium]
MEENNPKTEKDDSVLSPELSTVDGLPFEPSVETPRSALKEILRDAAYLSLLSGLLLLVLLQPTFASSEKKTASVGESPIVEEIPVPVFPAPDIAAKAAIVFDVERGETIFGKNENNSYPLASLTKVASMAAVLSVLPIDSAVTVGREHLAVEGDSGLYADEVWRAFDLAAFTLVSSSNDGARALAFAAGSALAKSKENGEVTDPIRIFTNEMNITVRDRGLSKTRFYNETGLDESPELSGGYGSARDFSILFAEAVKKFPSLFEFTTLPSVTFTSLSGRTHQTKNTNTFSDEIPVLSGSKTGFTDLAGGNLAILFNAGPSRNIAVVVLGSTESERFTDASKLVWAAIDYLRQQEKYQNSLE